MILASDSPEASDRAAVQVPCCHGVQCKAHGIRVSHVSIVAYGPFSGGIDGEPKKQQLEPEKQKLEMPSEEELDVLLERSDEADDDLMAEYELEQMMTQQLEEEHAEGELAGTSSAGRIGPIKGL